MKCKYCIEKEKTWSEDNSPIECAFEEWQFNWNNNWNCWTMDYLREIAENNSIWNEDQNAWLIPYTYETERSFETWYIYLEWYKTRCSTDKCIDMENIEDLTLEKAYNIIK